MKIALDLVMLKINMLCEAQGGDGDTSTMDG